MHQRWQEHFPDTDDVFELIEHLYRVPQRAYHNLAHIEACLNALNELTAGKAPREAVAAIWFHDCVYVPGASNNEAASAEIALSFAAMLAFTPEQSSSIANAILATEFAATPITDLAKLVVDSDLSILAADAETYTAYTQAIRQEWPHVSDEVFNPARLAILETFLHKPALYSTTQAMQRFESKARANLSSEIESLRKATT